MTPIVPLPGLNRRSWHRKYGPPAVVLLFGLVLALTMALVRQNEINRDAEVDFQREVSRVTEAVEGRFRQLVQGLNGLKSIYAVHQEVKRAEFRAAVESQDLAKEFPGVRGFGFFQQVSRKHLSAFVAAQRADSTPEFAIRQLAGKDFEDLFVIKFIEPASANVGALGLDIGSEANHRAAAQRAIDSGEPTITAPVVLVQDPSKSPSVLLFVPVYAKGSHLTSVFERRAALIGLVYAPLVMRELFGNKLDVRDGLIDFELFDHRSALTGSQPKTPLVVDADNLVELTNSYQDGVHEHRFSASQTFTFGGRDLLLKFNSTPGFDSSIDRTTPILIFLCVALLSALIALKLNRSKANTDAQLKELQLQRYAVDQHAIVAMTDVQGKITYVNDKFCEISGYSHDELMGQDHIMLNSGVHAPGFFKAMYRTISAGKQWRGDICNKARDGHLYWVDSTITAIIDSKGKPSEYLAVRSDVTLRKKSELDLMQQKLILEKKVQQEAESAISSERHLRMVMDSSFDSIIGIDDAGRVVDWSKAAEVTFGWKLHEVVGQYLHDLVIPERYREAQKKGLKHYLATDVERLLSRRIELYALRRNGTEFPVEMTISRIVTSQGTTFCAFVSDITQRKIAESAMAAANKELAYEIDEKGKRAAELVIANEELAYQSQEMGRRAKELAVLTEIANSANSAKSNFLANMSHEIRTPMNGVIGMVDILRQTRLDTEQSRMLSIVQRSAMNLLHILNDILDFSKIEAGMLTTERIPINLRELLEEVTKMMLLACNAKLIELTLFVSPALPLRIMSDPIRLRQVLLNLLSNAVKFTNSHQDQQGTLKLLAEPCVLAQNQAGVKLRVVDTGIGISADVQNKLFQPFTQADASTARKFGGTGLGLSISQRLVELMGGQISVRSALGEGSEFCIELALEVAPTWRMQVFGPSLQGLCVFAVIDNEEVRKIVRAYVLDAHAEITEFPSLDAVRTHMQDLPLRTDPAVVLLGLGARIADESLKLPAGLVQLVPYAKETVKHTNTVCHSPLMYGELIEAIAQASGRFGPGYMTHLAPMNVTQSQLHPNVEQALAKGQLILLAEDNEINRDVITEQLRRLGYACEVAFDGEQALAMWRSGRYALLLTDCHMPHMDGFELTKAIREAEPEGKRLPIVAITANAMQGEVQRCRERGMDDYLSKPTRMHALATMLHKWLPLATVRLQALTAGAEAMPDVAPAWDANTLSQMVGDNPAMHRRLLERFLVISETQVEAIVLSSDAGEFSDAADVAHAFKSASRMVGALALGDLCEQLETVSSVGDETACLRLTEDLVQALAQARLSITQHLESLPHEAP